ncbi:M12 family metallopeptidase [Novosphingobium percolationis]|uniref:M12 family metallopeptidase n=1 Tax=Novosphingobium percolationis TaxID=2871811 RepID=UPI001CD6B422|nr:M12 family metallopeptidase [Novosphingobium percolationis]
MSNIISYSPNTLISKAMFNFDAFGLSDFKVDGTIRVSVSDFVDPDTGATQEIDWDAATLANIYGAFTLMAQFAAISFTEVTDYDTAGTSDIASQIDVGAADVSDFNITLFFDDTDSNFLGISGGGLDDLLGYAGSAGDVLINYFGSTFNQDLSFSEFSNSRQTLLHELGHSLGLSHPHADFDQTTGEPILSEDFSALVDAGFQALGFNIETAADLYKEFFSIMSYDDQSPLEFNNAFTPMILDVIALQQAYGEGGGTSGAVNDRIVAGTVGYRTYFDLGGTDTIDGSLYDQGIYINLGVPIVGADHLVGVVMSLHDAEVTVLDKGNPASLRWLYGEYENASGSAVDDLLVGNALVNKLTGLDGDDYLSGGAGNDQLTGGAGADVLDGEDGADRMFGGAGNDTFVVDATGDRIYETIGTSSTDTRDAGGTDTVVSTVSYNLGATNGARFVENLTLGGTANISGTGNDLANTLIGNGGANVLRGLVGNDVLEGGKGADKLIGGKGKDVLTGGAGKDVFVFDDAATVRDTIADFSHKQGDRIQLSQSAFSAFGYTGALHAEDFYAAAGATKAHDASDRIVYNTTTGLLYYDADGLGGTAAIAVALLGTGTHPALAYGDLQIVA